MQKKLQLFDHIRRGRKWQAWTSTDWTMTDRFCPLQVEQRWPASLLTPSIGSLHQRSLYV